MILLDTHALIWLEAGHPRARPLLRRGDRLYVSPISLFELQIAYESKNLRLRGVTPRWVLDDDRWVLDEPPATDWFLAAGDVGWTRDPFDRLIVAHAELRRWKLATADAQILERLGSPRTLEL